MEIEIEIKRVICSLLDIGETDIKSESTLKDLGADSLDRVEIMIELEKVFEVDLTPNYPHELYLSSINEITAAIEDKLLQQQNID